MIVFDLFVGIKVVKDYSLKFFFFGVFDGYGGDKVVLFVGDNIYNIIVKQDIFKVGNYEQVFKDGFLVIDRVIFNGMMLVWFFYFYKMGGFGWFRFVRGGRLCDLIFLNYLENGVFFGMSLLICCCFLNRF